MNLIIGGGVGGLSAAYYSSSASLIFDKEREFGGRIKSLESFDSCDLGAQYFSSADSNVLDLLKKLKIEKEIQPFNLISFLILNKNSNIKNSKSILEISKSKLHEFSTFSSYFYSLDENIRKDFDELSTKTLNAWYCEHFGGELIWFLDCLTNAIAFSNSQQISAIYGLMVIASFFEKTYTFQPGLSFIVERISKSLAKKNCICKLATPVSRINFRNNYAKSIETAAGSFPVSNKLISAIPATSLSYLAKDLPVFSNLLKKVNYSSCGVVTYRIKKNILETSPGILFAGEPVSTIINRASQNHSKERILTCLVPCRKYLDFRKITEKTILKIDPDFNNFIISSNVHFWKDSLPICSPDLLRLQKEILACLPLNLRIASDFIGYPSIDASIGNAKISTV